MEKQLAELEHQAEAIIRNYNRTKQENAYLRERQAQLMEERDTLQKKNDDAINKLKELVHKLKAIEGEQCQNPQ